MHKVFNFLYFSRACLLLLCSSSQDGKHKVSRDELFNPALHIYGIVSKTILFA